jgi:hypothetical protein
MSEFFSQPDDAGQARASEAQTSMWGRLGAQAADTLDPKDSLSGMFIGRRAREAAAGGEDQAVGAGGDIDVFSGQSLEERQSVIDTMRAAIPDISKDDAKLLLKQSGLSETDVHLGDQDTHKLPVLKMQIDEAHTRRDREAAIARGPQGFFPGALGMVTSLGVGMIDPVNAAAFSIPVIGEARMGKILASAGDSILARGAARFGQGAAQGAVGTAILQPADWWLHTNDGQDYTMAQALESVIMGAGMGGAFHAIPGGVRDVLARRRGDVLEGSPQDQLLRALAGGEVKPVERAAPENGSKLPDVRGGEDVPGIEPVVTSPHDVTPVHPADVMADLPPAAREDAVHAAMADIISGRPTRAAEMLSIAADHDPRIAESIHSADAVIDHVAEPVAGFTTSKGSTYQVHEDGTTTRDKAARSDVGHEGDSGPKERSAKTVYLDKDAINGMAVPQDTRWRVIDHGDGTMSLATWNDARKDWGISPGSRNIPYSEKPAIGLHPLEVWKPENIKGLTAYKGMHRGNEITEVRGGRAPPPTARSSHAVAAADPRWRELSDRTPDYNEPDVLAESEAASHVPEPDSVQAAKSLTALEKAAADAEEVWRQLEPTLTEQERALVNNALDQLKLDAEARSKIITDGVTCLAGAIG